MHETSKPHVLVVDDSDISREIICDILRGMGVLPVEAGNGLEACEIFTHRNIDLILMDLRMPLMDGMEATRRIRESSPSVPILAMTAAEDDADKSRALSLGMNGFLAKPVAPEALQDSIGEWLTLASLTTAQETPSTESPLRGKNIYGISMQQALANVAGNESLYANLLLRFAEKYKHSAQDFADELADRESLARLAHTIKGVAANLGMKKLAALAGALESAIRTGQETDDLHRAYGQELGMILAGIEEIRPARAPKSRHARPLAADEIPHLLFDLDRLPRLMHIDWGQAQRILEDMDTMLGESEARDEYEMAMEAFEDFDFDRFTSAVAELTAFVGRCAKN